ncbi:MAG TPA: NYN domain-containing protein [Thermoanaerobaculia bacterium]|nr:NYN domain-containing protein [Thermoanaerobaculia bacterium]
MTPWWLRHPDDETPAEPEAEPAGAPPAAREEAPAAAAGEAPAPPAAEDGEEPGAPEPGDEPVTEPAAGDEGGAEGEAERARSKRRRGRRRSRTTPATAGEEGAAEGEAEEEREAPDEPPTPPVRPAVRPPARATEASGMIAGFEQLARELAAVMAPPARHDDAEERKIAMFCDLENVALGVRDSEVKKFDIELVLERLLEKGKIIVKRAYADWERYSEFKKAFHEAAIELIDIPQRYYSGKNSADIKMVVDAMDLCYAKEHLDTFVLVSGDSDFSPLVSKLKENNKTVIGIGMKNSSSALLVDNCDEFLYYEDLWRSQQAAPQLDGLPKKKAEAFALLTDSILALMRENKPVLWGSMIKETMKRKKPSFNEGYYGYSTFSDLLEDAERANILKLRKDRRAGTYVVEGFAKSK